jgi:hypothetical protein
MKIKYLVPIIFVLFSQTTHAQNTVMLDEAIKASAEQIMRQVLMRSAIVSSNTIRVAILDFAVDSVNSVKKAQDYIDSELTNHFLMNPRFEMVDRQNLDRARRELKFNMTGEVSDSTAQGIGHFVGAQIVVFGSIRKQGNIHRMQTRAISVEGGVILGQATANISSKDMKRLLGKAKEPKSGKIDLAYRNNVDVGILGYFQWGDGIAGGGGSPFGIRFSPVPFTVLGLETRLGGINNGEDAEFIGGIALLPGLVYPLINNEYDDSIIKWYADGCLEIGSFGLMNGILGEPISVGFDTGLLFFDLFDIKYRGTWYEDHYLHSISMSFVFLGRNNWIR